MDKHYDNLRRALDRLPSYAPPAGNWSEIERGLGLQQLPTYAPPATVWNAVNAGLDAPVATGRTVRLRPRRRWAAVAAAIALVASISLALLNRDFGPDITYAYTQEAMPTTVDADWDNEEASFASVREQVQLRNEPRLNNLGYELDELTSAREEVKAMLVSYGESADVVQQLAEIERERNDVYRQIIVEL